jgi:uncharacterized membrane protein SirB2
MTMNASLFKFIHVTSVVLAYSLFFLRGVWMLCDSPSLQQRWVKVVPHAVDTLLFVSAIALTWQLGLSPLTQPWLAAMIIAVPFYIGIGTIALKRGKTMRIRFVAWLMAQAVFIYIASVAATHNPAPWQSLQEIQR